MKATHLHFIPECYVDTNLTQILMRVKCVNHQNSCGQVTNVMQKKFDNQFSVGIIDLDKRQSSYSTECFEIARSHELSLCKHPHSHHYLVKIIHIMETFILNSAKELNLDLKEFGIEHGLNDLKKITKDSDSLDNNQLRRLLKAVSHANEMSLLAEILTYLDKARYDAKETDLKSIFSSHGF